MNGMAQLVKDNRENPGTALAGRLVRHPAGLTDDELTMDMQVMMIFGQAPTSDWIGNTLRLMLIDDYWPTPTRTCARGRSATWAPIGRTCRSDTEIMPARWVRRRSPRPSRGPPSRSYSTGYRIPG